MSYSFGLYAITYEFCLPQMHVIYGHSPFVCAKDIRTHTHTRGGEKTTHSRKLLVTFVFFSLSLSRSFPLVLWMDVLPHQHVTWAHFVVVVTAVTPSPLKMDFNWNEYGDSTDKSNANRILCHSNHWKQIKYANIPYLECQVWVCECEHFKNVTFPSRKKKSP